MKRQLFVSLLSYTEPTTDQLGVRVTAWWA